MKKNDERMLLAYEIRRYKKC